MRFDNLVFFTSFAFNLCAWSYVLGRWAWPRLRELPLHDALEPVLALHAFRAIGLAFLVPGLTGSAMDPAWAALSAWGDVGAAALAGLALALALRRSRAFVPAAWAFSVWGSLDLLRAISDGMEIEVQRDLNGTWFIPTLLVPLLLATHALGFVLLARRWRAVRGSSAATRP